MTLGGEAGDDLCTELFGERDLRQVSGQIRSELLYAGISVSRATTDVPWKGEEGAIPGVCAATEAYDSALEASLGVVLTCARSTLWSGIDTGRPASSAKCLFLVFPRGALLCVIFAMRLL